MNSSASWKRKPAINWTANALVVVCAFVMAIPADAAQFFRYKDQNGSLVLSNSIPNALVRFGYDIVDENARVIQRVEPQLSDEAYRVRKLQEAAQLACEQAVYRVKNLYQGLDDIDYSEEQTLAGIQTRIENTEANLVHVRNQRTALESQAAQMDLSGQLLTSTLLANIERAQVQEQTLLEEISQRKAEQAQAVEEYNADREVFMINDCSDGLPQNLVAQVEKPVTDSEE